MDADSIRMNIEAALADDCDEAVRQDIAFHMTDWLPSLEALVRVYQDPVSATEEQIRAALMEFLVHAPAHIAAAAKLLTGSPVTDVFDIGAVE
jgi:hypothetical protein